MSIIIRTGRYILLFIGSVIMILPFIWMVSTSLKTGGATLSMPPEFIPQHATLDSYFAVVERFPTLTLLKNSVLIAIFTTIGTLLNSVMSAYAFSRLQWKGRDKVFLLYLATMMIPSQVIMIPQFIILKEIGWLDTYYGLIIPNIFSVFGVFLMRQAFLGIPKELEEAAFMDGANHLTVCFKIIVPLVKPMLATLSIFTFMQSWNNYLWPLIISTSREMATLPLGLALLHGQRTTNWNLMMAGVVISVIPILAVYIFSQKYFIQGMTMSGMKE